ncbi:phytanoyl-CoA dioxygenase family protein [Skeletonema marinoi]|uniref:Phytanoyl-CoA dioxygenase family protein n=1 Tax=Skeletonema marinoi TaxID=267567 RepID=A0AAD8Y2G1_9STRA|nr:phytanoyl-CoA dioxygenase family protein [Skeletonema marinoi]
MNLFGNSTAAPSLTESIFGSSPSNTDNPPSNNDLFSKSIPQQQPPSESRKRPRTGKKHTEKPSVKKATSETPRQTLQRRHTQSQHSILEQFTISAQDYQHSGGEDELYTDVRSLMRHHGLVILRNALSEQDVTTITTIADDTQRHICDALDAKKIPYNSSVANEETETFVYKELAVRCQGRMDVRYDYDDNVTTRTTKQQQQQLPSSLIELVDNLAASILHGAEPPSLVYSGWIFSHPGSANQPWHTDGSPLFGNGINESLPSYAINIFVGLHNADELLVLGPTEFVVGSHQMDPEVVMDTMIDTAVPAVIGKGDVLLYDYRVCHRGTANLSSTLSVAPSSASLSASGVVDKEDDHDETSGGGVVRKVLYQMYARPWFKEHLNFGEKSLFEE